MEKSFDNTRGKIRKMFDDGIVDKNTIIQKKSSLDNSNNIIINLEQSSGVMKRDYRYGGDWVDLTLDTDNGLLYATWSVLINYIKPASIPFIRKQINIKSPDDSFQTSFPVISHKTILIGEDTATELYFIRLDSSIAFSSGSTSMVQAKLNIRIFNPEIYG